MCNPLLTHVARSADDGDSFPDELKVPLSRSDDLLDNGVIISTIDINEDPKAPEGSGLKAEEIENGPPVVSFLAKNGTTSLTHKYCRILPRTAMLCRLCRHRQVVDCSDS